MTCMTSGTLRTVNILKMSYTPFRSQKIDTEPTLYPYRLTGDLEEEFAEKELALVNEDGDTTMTHVNSTDIKNLSLSDDDRLLLEAHVIDAKGELTENGNEIVLLTAFATHKDEIVANVKKAKANKESN